MESYRATRLAHSFVWGFIGVACASCGSGSSSESGPGACNGVGSASVNGMVQGAAFDPKDAISAAPNHIQIANFSGVCAFGLAEAKAGASYIDFFFQNGFQLGTTQVGPNLDVMTPVYTGCNSVADTASSGSVTLTSVDSCSVTGTFDVIILSSQHLTGSFTAPMCTAPGNSTCM
jgi:hypothetical protein